MDSRERLIDSTIELISRGNPRPTGGQIAELAGVSVGSLFYHYPQVEVVVEAALSRTFEQHLRKIVPLPSTGPVGTRVKTICRQRLLLFEALGPMLVAAHARAAAPNVAALLTELRSRLREQLARTLHPEIVSCGSSGPLLMEELLLASSWQSWEALRFDAGYPPTTAEKIMIHNLLKVLE